VSSVANIILGTSDVIKLKFMNKISVYDITIIMSSVWNIECGASDVIKLKLLAKISVYYITICRQLGIIYAGRQT
jgi:hypothetical protein